METLLVFGIGIISGMYFHYVLTKPTVKKVYYREYEPVKIDEQIMN